jgi:hypothetical protein
MLLALMIIVSSPVPALRTSIPPLPVRISLPAPATKISSLVVPVRILSFLVLVVLLLLANQWVIIVAAQSPAQVMLTVMA